ncbi:MAG: DUF5937 family protein [Gaiellales bacterium]
MAIVLELDSATPRTVRWAVSPLVEAALSINSLLFRQSRPVQHPWIRATRELPPPLRRELRAFGFVFDFAIPDCVLPTPRRSLVATWDEALAGVAALTPREAAYEITRPAFHYVLEGAGDASSLSRDDVRAQLLERARRYGHDGVALARLAFTEPEALQARFLALLDGYWHSSFAETWARLEPQLAATARLDARRAAAAGVLEVLDARFADTIVDRAKRTVTRRSPHRHTVRPTRSRPLVFIPSFFVWPHLRVNCDEPWPLALIYPPRMVLEEARLESPPRELASAYAAIGDRVNLTILRALVERPRPPEELAPLVPLSASATSRRLAALARAGIVEHRREGHYLVYRMLPERLHDLEQALRGFLLSPRQP